MLDPIIKTIEVPCSQEKAFNIFLNEMDSWWPKDKFTTSAMAGTPAAEIKVEAKLNGKIIEVSSDGKEYYWGKLLSFKPFDSFQMDFHFAPPGEERGDGTIVDLNFIVINEKLTKVELKQTNWQALGSKEKVAAIRGGYDYGWNIIFMELYSKACSL